MQKSLCYNCDEPFNQNYACKEKVFALLIELDSVASEDKLKGNTHDSFQEQIDVNVLEA